MASLPTPVAPSAPAAIPCAETTTPCTTQEMEDEAQASSNVAIAAAQAQNQQIISSAPPLATTTCGILDVLFGNCSGCSLTTVVAGACTAAPDSAINFTPWLIGGGLLLLGVVFMAAKK